MYRRLSHKEAVGKHPRLFNLIGILKDSEIFSEIHKEITEKKMKTAFAATKNVFVFEQRETLETNCLGKLMNSTCTICLRDLKSPKQKLLITSWWWLLVLQNSIPHCFLLPLWQRMHGNITLHRVATGNRL